MTISYAIAELKAIIQRLDDLQDLASQHPLYSEEENAQLQRNVSDARTELEHFCKPNKEQ